MAFPITSFLGLVLWSPVLQPCRWLDHVQLDHPFEFPASGGLHKAATWSCPRVHRSPDAASCNVVTSDISPDDLGTTPINWTDGPVKTCRKKKWTPNPRSSSDVYWLHPIFRDIKRSFLTASHWIYSLLT